MARLERLTYVHDGDQGLVGGLISEARGVVRFLPEGSGLLDVSEPGQASTARTNDARDVSVRIVAMLHSQLPPEGAQVVDQDVPCILGHSGSHVAVLVPSRSLARMTGGMSNLRGKIKFGVARLGWDL